MRITVDELDVFQLSGPTYLLDSGQTWSHANSLRAVMACLVQAVYALDKDRTDVTKMRLPPLAPDWHLPFKYRLVKTLQEAEGSEQIVGAVFKWSRRLSPLRAGIAPKVVIAFRGTIPFGDTLRSDLMADLDVIMLQLHKTPRFSVALKEVEQAVAHYGARNVCMTGHSLGAAVCLLVGRTLALRNCFVNAHLFSPPFPSLDHLCSLKALAAALVANFVMEKADQETSPKVGDSQDKNAASEIDNKHLKNWQPHLYINTHDPICAAYVAYFREVESVQAQNGDSQAMHRSLRSLMQAWAGREAMPFHLIPCARLYFTDAVKGFKKAHGMKQWWSQETSHIKTRIAGLAAAT